MKLLLCLVFVLLLCSCNKPKVGECYQEKFGHEPFVIVKVLEFGVVFKDKNSTYYTAFKAFERAYFRIDCNMFE